MADTQEGMYALPNCRHGLSLCIGIRVGRIGPNHSATYAQPSPPATPQSSLDQVTRENPGWFSEPNPYKPCPSSVVFPNGNPACLGCPTPCRWHFRKYK